MDIGWLQDFLTVAELGNFTKAAEQRNASQAAFSRRIQSLETWLGVILLDRSVFPARLTPDGERFREYAASILSQVVDARIGMSGQTGVKRDQVRVALPHTLATGRLPQWWTKWSEGRNLNCQVISGNVHETVTFLVSGSADLLVCFHHAQQPIHLESEQYERLVIGEEMLRPYVLEERAKSLSFPGKQSKPVPWLNYSSGAYLGRMVNLILENAPETFVGNCVFENDMADVLCGMAEAGLGVAWLPDCAVERAHKKLVPVGDDKWSMTLSLVAYRDRTNNRPAIKKLWSGLLSQEYE